MDGKQINHANKHISVDLNTNPFLKMCLQKTEREQNKTKMNVERKGNIQIRGAIRMRFIESILFTDTTI